jgi:energy-coupling factor transporter ATP-binding protein EcfA2
MPPFTPATTLLDVYEACHPEKPLEPGDPRYVDLREVRGGLHFARIIYRRIRSTEHPEYHQHLLTGHRGCGKSTELRQIRGALQAKNLFCVYFDVEDVLDVNDLEYLDVLLAIARAVHERLHAEQIPFPDDALAPLTDWFAEVVLTRTAYEQREAEARAEARAKGGLPGLLSLLVSATSSIRSGGERRQEVRQKLRKDQKTFLDRLNDLLTLAQRQVVHAGHDALVVIVDGLEKMPYRQRDDGSSNHASFFILNADALKKPNCHLIYTVPISLLLNQNLSDAFPDFEVLPMVTPEARGLAKLREVIASRIDLDAVFADASVVDRFAAICGGTLRDLLRVVRFACDETDDRITDAHAEAAIQRLVRDYDYQVKTDDLPKLVEIARTQRLPGDDDAARLLHQRLVLEYFDADKTRHADVHPAVKRTDAVRAALDAARDEA